MTIIRKIKPFNLDNNASFTFGNVTANGNVIANGNISTTNANLGNAATANFFIGNGSLLTGLPAGYTNSNVASYLPTYTGNITSGNASLGNAVTANFFIGSGNNLSNLQAANITGTVSSATTAGTVTTAAQPNITSVGTLTSITASGDATIGGNLTVNGTTTTINATTLNVADLNITLANGATTAAAANGAGLTVNGASATMLYISGTDTWDFNKPIVGNLTGLASSATVAASANAVAGANVSGEVTSAATANAVAGANVSGQVANALVAGTVYTNAQPNITSVGTLTSLVVGNATSNTTFGNGTITALGNIAFSGANISLGSVSNLHITGGTANYVLQTDGSGNLSWAATAGGGGAVSGSNTQIQFNDGGVLGASANLSFNKTSNTLSTDRLVAVNGANLGSVSNVYISGGSANQILKTDGAGNLTWMAQPAATITVDNFTGTGSQTTFTLSVIPTSINQTVINYNGAFQLRSAYTLSGANVIFTEAPESGSAVEVTTTLGLISGAGAFVTRTYTGNGIANTYAVTSGSTVSSVLVSENGLVQTPTTDYTISGSTLTFVNAPGSGIQIQVRELAIAVAEFSGNLGAVANLTITGGANGQVLTSNGASGVSWQTITVPTVPESLSPFLFL
jgi:hypothetical protein